MRYITSAAITICLMMVMGCPRHRVEVTTKDPIVVKLEANVHIYNHAQNIEDIVSGEQPLDVPEDVELPSSYFFDPFASSACAADARVLRKAVMSRKARYGRVQELKQRGIAGESLLGYLEIRSRATPDQKRLVRKENEDRKIIYVETANEKGYPVSEIQRGFSDVLRKKAEPGMWIETERGWVRKK